MRIVKLTMEHVIKGTETVDLPEHFVGTKKQCLGAMIRHEFKKDESLFGGYWVDENGDCYSLLP